jgi:primosomal protein N'
MLDFTLSFFFFLYFIYTLTMFITVIPTTKSQGKYPYSYFVSSTWDEQISIGGLVEIPYGKDILVWIVVSKENTPPHWMEISDIRPIHSVLSTTPILDGSTLEVICELAERYFLPIHKALALFLPAPLLSRLEKRNYILEVSREIQSTHIPPEIHHYINQTFSPEDCNEYLTSGSVLIFPDDIMLYTFMESRKKEKTILVLPTESTSAKRVQAWIDIFEWKYEIIVWTRRLLYYNLSAYKSIVYIEDAFGSQQFQYPITLRSLDVLTLICAKQKQQCILVSSSPTLELFAKFPWAKITSIKKRNPNLS